MVATSVLLIISLRRLPKHRNDHTDQGRKRYNGVGGVRILPLDRNSFQLLGTTVQLLVA